MPTRLSPTAGTTEATLVQNVAKILQDSPWLETHSDAPSAGATTITVATGATDRFEVGDTVEWLVDASYERAQVTAVAATTLTLLRGIDFTTAASHLASARFRKNPRFWGINIQRAVNDAVAQDLYPDLFAVYEDTHTPASPAAYWYEAEADAEDILSAYQKTDSTPVQLSYLAPSPVRFVDSTLSTTKKAFYLPWIADADNTIFVQYTIQPAIADLSVGMVRIVEYGACKRLLEWEGAQSTEADRPQSGTLVPGQEVRDARWFAAEQERLINQERAILERRFPRRKRNWIPYRHVAELGS